MLQVDANIGGRQDQKNNGLRTKTWAVGLLIVLGCFVVGYFGATTTTTTAYTRMSSPNVDDMVTNLQRYPYFAITNETPYASFVVNMGNGKYANIFCNDGPDHVDSRQTWTASTRIACIVSRMDATLFPPQTSTSVKCTPYLSVPGTTYSIFSILMKGDDACCVVSNQYGTTQKCP